MLKDIKLNTNNPKISELIFRFNVDRFQAVAFHDNMPKEEVAKRLHILAENIANDKLIE